MTNKYIADFSLALINRTGAYYICRDIIEHIPSYFEHIRYWRLVLKKPPDGLIRKLLGRAMLMEISRLGSSSLIPRVKGRGASNLPTLFFDPLYVLRAELQTRDIVLCHDIGPITHQALFEAATTRLYREAYGIIRQMKPGMVFVSQASRDEFIHHFGDDYRFLEVIPLYVRNNLTAGEERQPPGVEPPFLLTVGAMEIRKNYHRIIPAFAASGLRERGFSYVFCGPRANNTETIERLSRETPGVKPFGYLNDAELRWLYRRAEGFVLPSLLEGFGVPALEAAKFGLIPIVAREGAQREAVGEGAILVDPNDIASIADGMKILAAMGEDEKLRRRALVRDHADALTQERFIARWADLLSMT